VPSEGRRYRRRRSHTYTFRRGGSWDVEELQAAMDDGADGFEFHYLERVALGQEVCGGCRQPFPTMNDAALVVTSFTYDEPWELEVVGYCMRCATEHADAIADEAEHPLAS
jgi:hypothetical protein